MTNLNTTLNARREARENMESVLREMGHGDDLDIISEDMGDHWDAAERIATSTFQWGWDRRSEVINVIAYRNYACACDTFGRRHVEMGTDPRRG